MVPIFKLMAMAPRVHFTVRFSFISRFIFISLASSQSSRGALILSCICSDGLIASTAMVELVKGSTIKVGSIFPELEVSYCAFAAKRREISRSYSSCHLSNSAWTSRSSRRLMITSDSVRAHTVIKPDWRAIISMRSITEM